MKKFLLMCLIVVMAAATSSAQTGNRAHRLRSYHNDRLTRFERFQLHRDITRYRITRSHAGRDGRITPYERRKLTRMRHRTRADAYRFRHNGRHRVI